MPQDWLFQTENGTCEFRCAALLLRDGKVLLQRSGGEYALPGGHVQHGETGEAAVKREFQEELGVDIRCQRMLWSEELFWIRKGKLTHMLSFYYLAELVDENALPDEGAFWPMKANANVEMGWVPVEQIADLTVYPEFLKERINDLRPGHFITWA